MDCLTRKGGERQVPDYTQGWKASYLHQDIGEDDISTPMIFSILYLIVHKSDEYMFSMVHASCILAGFFLN